MKRRKKKKAKVVVIMCVTRFLFHSSFRLCWVFIAWSYVDMIALEEDKGKLNRAIWLVRPLLNSAGLGRWSRTSNVVYSFFYFSFLSRCRRRCCCCLQMEKRREEKRMSGRSERSAADVPSPLPWLIGFFLPSIEPMNRDVWSIWLFIYLSIYWFLNVPRWLSVGCLD